MTVGGVGGTYSLSRFLFSPPSSPILIPGESSLCGKDVTQPRGTHASALHPGTGAGISEALDVPSSFKIQS